MRVRETERDYNWVLGEWSQDGRMGKRSYEGTQKDMGRAEFQTKLICLSLRLKRSGRGDQRWSMGLEEERGRPKNSNEELNLFPW